MAEEENKKNKKEKIVFIIRAVFWFLFAAVIPFLFIALRFGIFKTTTKTQLTGWGIIGIVIIIIPVITFLNYLYKGLKVGLFKQCVGGVVKIIIPLVAFYAIINSLSNNVEVFKEAMGCVILCETIAIPINPFPTWLANQEKIKFESLSDIFWDKMIQRREKNGNK